MNLDKLLAYVRHPERMADDATAELEALVQEFPYFQAAHLLLLKHYKQQNSSRFSRQLRRTAMLAPSRVQVYHLVGTWPQESEQELIQAAAGTDLIPSGASSATPEATEREPVAPEQLETVGEDLSPKEAETDSEIPSDTSEVAQVSVPAGQAEEVERPTEEAELSTEAGELQDTTADQFTEHETVAADDTPIAEVLDEKEAAETGEPTEPVAEMPKIEEVLDVIPAAALAIDDKDVAQVPDPPIAARAAGQSPDPVAVAAFLAQPHDRFSWFRFFAGKPLREQADEVLDRLYQAHLQQDLLQAPRETATLDSIRAKINHDEEVPSSASLAQEIKRLAFESISDDELPASETLAGIYVAQHDYKKAIRIYQKLILKFPDKMSYFAARIEELRSKI